MDVDSGGVAAAASASLSTGSSTGSRKAGDRGGVSDQFPAGLRVLVVDDDPTCLMILEKMLRNCLYEVTTCSRAEAALSLLRKMRGGFDLVLSDVYMPDMDGFKLLEHIGLEMDLPVIMMSADDGKDVVMKGVTHGACDYLIKPVRIEAIKNIWQHVVRKRRNELKESEHSGSVEDNDRQNDRQRKLSDDADYASSAIEGSWRHSKRRKDGKDEEDEGEGREDSSATKKPRVVWSVELHQQFVAAVNQLNLEKAVPKKILELMNVPGMTRENVASHLQKYRLYLRRLSSPTQHPGGPNESFMGATEAPFGSISSLDGLDLQDLVVSGQLPPHNLATGQAGYGRTSTNTSMGMSLGYSVNLFNSDAQITNSTKIRCGLPGQELSNKPINLLHGLPTSIEPKQLVHYNRPIHSFRNVGPQVGIGNSSFLNSSMPLVRTISSPHGDVGHNSQNSSLMMQMGQQRTHASISQSQIRMQVDASHQQQLRGQLLNEIVGGRMSGLLLPIGQQMLSDNTAGQVLGRNGAVVSGRVITSSREDCTNSSSCIAVSQAPSIDIPISNGTEFLGGGVGLPSLSSMGMFQEATLAVGSMEGLNNHNSMKGVRNPLPSYELFSEPRHNISPTYNSSQHTNSIRFGSLILGHQSFDAIRKNGQNMNECIIGKGTGPQSAQDENGKLVMCGQNRPAVNNSFRVETESRPNVRCENMLLAEQFVQDDLMSALFKQQEVVGSVETEINFDGYPINNIQV